METRIDDFLVSAPLIDDFLVSAPLTGAKCIDGHAMLGKEHPTNGSDHRAVALHCDIDSYIGMGPPRPPKDDVKLGIRAVTSTLEKGELSKVATAYKVELEALHKGNSVTAAVHRNNTVGKRAKDAANNYEKAKKAGRPCQRHKRTLERPG